MHLLHFDGLGWVRLSSGYVRVSSATPESWVVPTRPRVCHPVEQMSA